MSNNIKKNNWYFNWAKKEDHEKLNKIIKINIFVKDTAFIYLLKGESKFPTDRNCAVFVHPFGWQ